MSIQYQQPASPPEEWHPRVYVVQCHETGRVKIGQSNQPWRRSREIASAAPTRCSVAFVLNYGPEVDGKALERLLHRYFAPERVRGEWFRIDQVEVIRALEAMARRPIGGVA